MHFPNPKMHFFQQDAKSRDGKNPERFRIRVLTFRSQILAKSGFTRQNFHFQIQTRLPG